MTSPFPPTFTEHAAELQRLEGRARAARRRELETLYSVSPTTMSRWLNSIGIQFKARADKGQRRTELTEDHLKAVFAVQYSSYKRQQGPILPAKDVIEIAEKNGYLPQGILSPSSYNAWLRASGIARTEVDAPTRHINLVSRGPNHVHQVDFSLAINWKIKNNKAIYEHLVYKNKLPAAGEPRLLRFICTDHCTGSFFVWYTAAAGENISALIEGLWHAWTPKAVAGEDVSRIYPFRGVPRILMMDRGPGSKSQILTNFLDWLGVKLNICEGPRSKGQVESTHWLWETRFEGRFRVDPVVSIERLNDEAVDFAGKICKSDMHTRTRATRSYHWEFHLNRRTESMLRVPNCTFSEAKRYAVSTAKIASVAGDGTISFRGEKYRIPDVILQERKVAVEYSPFSFPSVAVKALQPNAVQFLCAPIVRNEHGFDMAGAVIGQDFKAHKDSAATTRIKDAKQAVAELTSGARLVTRGYHLEGLEASGIRSKTEEISAVPAPRSYSRVQARAAAIAGIGRPFTPAEAQYINEIFGQTVTEAEVDAAVAEISGGLPTRILAFPKTAGGSR